jgi:hypothetical protein
MDNNGNNDSRNGNGEAEYSQTCSDTAGTETGHQQYYEGTRISVGSQENPCLGERCTELCSAEHSAQENTETRNKYEAKEEKLSDLSDTACTESYKDHINESVSKATVMEPDTLGVEPGTLSLGTHSDDCTSYRNFLPRDRFTSCITHSTPVTDASRTKSSSTFFNKCTSVTPTLPRKPSVSFSTKSPSFTDIIPGKASTYPRNISTYITDSPQGDPSSDKCKGLTSFLPEEKPKSLPYKSSILAKIFPTLLPVRGSLPKNLSESVSDKSKSEAASYPAERDYTGRTAQVSTNQLLNSKQPLEQTSSIRSSPCYLHTKTLPGTPSSPSTAKDVKNGKIPMTEPILKHHQTGEFTDFLPTGTGIHADTANHVSWSIKEEPLLSSTKVTNINTNEDSIADNSESRASTKRSLGGTHLSYECADISTCIPRSELNISPEKHNILKYTNFCTLNVEGFEDQKKSKDGKKEFLIYSGSILCKRQAIGYDSNGINNCDFNLNITEETSPNDIGFSSSEACIGGCKQRKSIGLSDEPNIEESVCQATDISKQQFHHIDQLRKPPGTSVTKGHYRNPEKSPKHKDKTYTSDTCGNSNTTTDTCVGGVSGESPGREQKPQEKSEKPAESAKLRKVLWAITRVNIFEDGSRTYEIMKPGEESPTAIPEITECIFVVMPRKKSN